MPLDFDIAATPPLRCRHASALPCCWLSADIFAIISLIRCFQLCRHLPPYYVAADAYYYSFDANIAIFLISPLLVTVFFIIFFIFSFIFAIYLLLIIVMPPRHYYCLYFSYFFHYWLAFFISAFLHFDYRFFDCFSSLFSPFHYFSHYAATPMLSFRFVIVDWYFHYFHFHTPFSLRHYWYYSLIFDFIIFASIFIIILAIYFAIVFFIIIFHFRFHLCFSFSFIRQLHLLRHMPLLFFFAASIAAFIISALRHISIFVIATLFCHYYFSPLIDIFFHFHITLSYFHTLFIFIILPLFISFIFRFRLAIISPLLFSRFIFRQPSSFRFRHDYCHYIIFWLFSYCFRHISYFIAAMPPLLPRHYFHFATPFRSLMPPDIFIFITRHFRHFRQPLFLLSSIFHIDYIIFFAMMLFSLFSFIFDAIIYSRAISRHARLPLCLLLLCQPAPVSACWACRLCRCHCLAAFRCRCFLIFVWLAAFDFCQPDISFRFR